LAGFAALIDPGVGPGDGPGAGTVAWCSAGHPAPYLRAGGALSALAGPGPLLGDRPDARYVTRSRQLGPGDELVFASAGVVVAVGDRALRRALEGGDARAAEARVLAARERAPHAAGDELLLFVVAD
jgi:serine phosphatase RsbU (regulator of sigma subunit)